MAHKSLESPYEKQENASQAATVATAHHHYKGRGKKYSCSVKLCQTLSNSLADVYTRLIFKSLLARKIGNYNHTVYCLKQCSKLKRKVSKMKTVVKRSALERGKKKK